MVVLLEHSDSLDSFVPGVLMRTPTPTETSQVPLWSVQLFSLQRKLCMQAKSSWLQFPVMFFIDIKAKQSKEGERKTAEFGVLCESWQPMGPSFTELNFKEVVKNRNVPFSKYAGRSDYRFGAKENMKVEGNLLMNVFRGLLTLALLSLNIKISKASFFICSFFLSQGQEVRSQS